MSAEEALEPLTACTQLEELNLSRCELAAGVPQQVRSLLRCPACCRRLLPRCLRLLLLPAACGATAAAPCLDGQAHSPARPAAPATCSSRR